ncbi:MAG: hypothetical protein HRU15_18065, partial [Planctomycetes bacterium]|nr:hypothetical protein [Planctomycetota bacterium]
MPETAVQTILPVVAPVAAGAGEGHDHDGHDHDGHDHDHSAHDHAENSHGEAHGDHGHHAPFDMS